MIQAKKPELKVNYQDFEVALDFYACGIAGAVFKNCTNGGLNAEQLSHKLYRLLTGNMFEI